MLARAADTFRRNVVDVIFRPVQVVRSCENYRNRVSDGYRQYDFDHRRRALDLSYGRQNDEDPRAIRYDFAEKEVREECFRENSNTWSVANWALLAAGLLAYLLFNSTKNGISDAEEKKTEDESVSQKSDKSFVLTRENFEVTKVQLKNNNPFITSLEVGFVLTRTELKELYDAIQDNTELGYISWHEDQVAYDFTQKIETKLIDNNRNYQYHPNDYVHGLLSRHAYKFSKAGDSVEIDNLDNISEKTREYLKNWEVAAVFDDVEKTGYYSAIYINNKTHQVVLANRGTEDIIKGLLSQNGDWKTNLEEILGGQIIVGQQACNYQATYEAVKLAKEKAYRLSITGHSLGAWLAELSAFYCHAYFDCRDIRGQLRIRIIKHVKDFIASVKAQCYGPYVLGPRS